MIALSAIAPVIGALACGLLAAGSLSAQIARPAAAPFSKPSTPPAAQEPVTNTLPWPQLLQLSRIKRRMADNLRRQPDYTCLETIERSQRRKPTRKFEMVDVLRLEVALVRGGEMFAWPGAKKFEDSDPRKFVPSGAIGNGYFAMHARSVFLSDAPVFTYVGPETLAGRATVRYDYRIPLLSSGYLLKMGERGAIVGYHGSFWASAATLDVLRLLVDADDIPVSLGIANADTEIDYERMKIGANDFLLPAASELILTDLAGSESRNRMRFTSCRQYKGESVLSFADLPPATPEPAAPDTQREIQLPPGLWIEAGLEQKIDSRTAAVGDPVRAVIHHDIKHDRRVLIPKGAELVGRITRLEHFNSMYAVAISCSSIRFRAGSAAFAGELEEIGVPSRPGESLIVGPGGDRFSRPSFRSVQDLRQRDRAMIPGTFYILGDRVQLPRGFRMVWRTESPPAMAAPSRPEDAQTSTANTNVKEEKP